MKISEMGRISSDLLHMETDTPVELDKEGRPL